ncbi:unnamed protein product [Durusdinium trenchii]|uniref:Uncharacterized protein n=1 Tax=Durusdinium trenchii TaxID=1381693 RepID=A0ABP0R555_9DINO
MAWQEKDISTWSKKSLPEYLFALQEGPCLLLTPWSHMEVRFSHIEVSGEVCLCGRKSEVLQFDLDIGVQLDIFKAVRFYQGPKREEPFFRGVLRIFHFEPNSIPEIQASFDRADAIMAEAAEVTWFLQKGMGSRLLLASLSRWQAAAGEQNPRLSLPSGIPAMVSFQNRLKHLEAKHNLMHSKHTLKVGMQRARPVASNKEWNQHSENGGLRRGMKASPSQPSKFRAPAAQLREVILRKDFAKAFKLLDDELLHSPVEGLCAIHSAVESGSSPMVALVIEARADVGRRDVLGRTPLMMALKKGNVALVKRLLEAGAFESEVMQSGEDSEWLTNKLSKDFRMVPEVLQLVEAKEKPMRHGWTLSKAILRDARTAEAAIEAGASPSCADERGDLPIHLLAKSSHHKETSLRLLQKLAKARADVNAKNRRAETPLLYAAHRGNLPVLEGLLRLRADPSLANEEGSTALMFAAHSGHEDVCKVLLEARALATSVNQHGLTAEEMATKRGFRSLGAIIAAYAMAPRDEEVDEHQEKKKHDKVEVALRASPQVHLEATSARCIEPNGRKSFDDYQKWDRIVEDLESKEEAESRRQSLEMHPEYLWKNGMKMRVLF